MDNSCPLQVEDEMELDRREEGRGSEGKGHALGRDEYVVFMRKAFCKPEMILDNGELNQE